MIGVRTPWRRVPAALLAAALLVGGCERWRLERTGAAAVRAYNEALVAAYRTNDPRGLERVAGEGEVRRLVALIDLKRSARLALESELQELEVTRVEAVGQAALQVRTQERWRYWDRPLAPGMTPGPVFVAEMAMVWEVGRVDGVWKVFGGRTERSEYLEPAGYRAAASGESGPRSAAAPAADDRPRP